ncbi:hypothetical protein ABVT39_021180 [Epinephelus coioides]
MKQFWKFVNDDRNCGSRKAVSCGVEKRIFLMMLSPNNTVEGGKRGRRGTRWGLGDSHEAGGWSMLRDRGSRSGGDSAVPVPAPAGAAPTWLWERSPPERLRTASFRSLRRAAEANVRDGSRWSGQIA